ncbi:hypothetical protein BDV93DRAFT_443999 [Ceratobasidium sp. AG-I]|nr:hypothetical protein BDV93DRAFT_443999 [Ceratobasidium sp. AG-I]
MKGVYTVKTRQLARKLVLAGIAAVRVPQAIQLCAQAFNVQLKHIPSARSVGRFVLEGGVGAEIQAANTLAQAQGVTISMDSTSQRSINYSAMHVMSNSTDAHQLLYLAVESTFNHSSQTQVNVLKNTIAHLCDTAARAPKTRENTEQVLSSQDVARKIYGASGDHANDQLKVATLEKEWKLSSWFHYLGNESILRFSQSEASVFLASVQSSAETYSGSADMFLALEPEVQASILEQQEYQLTQSLGEKAYSLLSPEEQNDIAYFVRFGCCMHKDMNAVKGGVSGFQKFWSNSASDIQPVLLPNKDNDAVINLSSLSTSRTHAEQRAISLSDSGAIKLCSLAGMLFNNKDDKKGLQDKYTFYFETKHGSRRRFPDTSNVRYGSFVDAATELFIYRQQYLSFMEYCRDKKRSTNWNHLEYNVHKALSDTPTVAELAVIALYGQIISKPYMQDIRNATLKGKSIAELGTLHHHIILQLQDIVKNPATLFQGTPPSMDKKLAEAPWFQPAVFAESGKLMAEVGYLPELSSCFFACALTTWERFTADILPKGLPLSLSPEETMKCFAPPTNDANEGALGTWRVWSRRFPCLTLHRFNAIMMNRMNKTEDYMQENFTPDIYTWLRQEARRIDSSKKEKKRKRQLVEATEVEAAENAAASVLRTQKKAKRLAHVLGVTLELDTSKVASLTGKELLDQLKAHRHLEESTTHTFSNLYKLRVLEKKKMLVELIEEYLAAHSMVTETETMDIQDV